jgi:hypothetical protein
MKSLHSSLLTGVCFAAALIGGFLLGGDRASADPILPGFDYFATPPGGAFVDLGGGPIPLQGVPLPNFALGLTDTVVARMDPGPPAGGTGIIDIELVALHLRSVNPIDVDPGLGIVLADLHITLDSSDRFFTGSTPKPDGTGAGPKLFNLPVLPSPTPIPPSIGLMELMHGGPGPHTGATMRASFGDPAFSDSTGPLFGAGLGLPGGGIYSTATAVIPGGNPANPSDVLAQMPAPQVMLASNGIYVHTSLNPSEYGGIILAAIQHIGPHPNTIPVADSIPEASSALFVLCAATGCGAVAYCRRRRA